MINSKRWEECARQPSKYLDNLPNFEYFHISTSKLPNDDNVLIFCDYVFFLFLQCIINISNEPQSGLVLICINIAYYSNIVRSYEMFSHHRHFHTDFLFKARQWEFTLENCDTSMNMVHNIRAFLQIKWAGHFHLRMSMRAREGFVHLIEEDVEGLFGP